MHSYTLCQADAEVEEVINADTVEDAKHTRYPTEWCEAHTRYPTEWCEAHTRYLTDHSREASMSQAILTEFMPVTSRSEVA